MSSQHFFLCAAPHVAVDPESLWSLVAGAWPSRPAPAAEHLDLDNLTDRLEDGQVDRPALDAPVLLLLPPDPDPQVLGTLDALREQAIPTLVLHDPGPGRPHVRTAGLHVEPLTADPAHLASVLQTLAIRELTVAEVRRELLILRHTHTSLSGQIARLHDELSLASAVQRGLLPAMPASQTVQFGVVYRPAGYVSGDIFGASRIRDGRIGFFLADAVGHGVPAALLTMLIHRSLRFDAGRRRGEGRVQPTHLLSRLNSELLNCKCQSQLFATAVCGTIDDETLEVTLACAGHPPPFRVAPHAPPSFIMEGGPLLGVFEQETFPQTTFTIQPGETLVIYSDGVENVFDAGPDDLPDTDTPRHLQRLLHYPWPDGRDRALLDPAIRAIQDELDRQSGSLHQTDDITILALAPLADAAEARRAA